MAAIWTRKSSRRVILNVFRNPRKRIGYCIALVPSTNCSIITISRCTPDTQRWRSAGAMEDRSWDGGECRKQIEIQQFGGKEPSYRRVPQLATVPVLPVITAGKVDSGAARHGIQEVTECRARRWGRDVAAEYTRQLSTEMKVTQYGGRHCHSTIDVGLSPVCSIVTVVTLYRVPRYISGKFYLILSAISNRFSFSIG